MTEGSLIRMTFLETVAPGATPALDSTQIGTEGFKQSALSGAVDPAFRLRRHFVKAPAAAPGTDIARANSRADREAVAMLDAPICSPSYHGARFPRQRGKDPGSPQPRCTAL
jgi:hypothetical protein